MTNVIKEFNMGLDPHELNLYIKNKVGVMSSFLLTVFARYCVVNSSIVLFSELLQLKGGGMVYKKKERKRKKYMTKDFFKININKTKKGKGTRG